MMENGSIIKRFVLCNLDGIAYWDRYIEMVAPLPKEGASLVQKTKITGIHNRGGGALIETEARIVGENEKLYYIVKR